MLQRDPSHIAVVVSANPARDVLRRRLLDAGIAPAGITTSIRGLRRSLMLGEFERVTICVTLDVETLTRHGEALRTLLRDQRGFATTLTAIGITGRQPLSADAASIGCTIYLESLAHAVDAVCYFENTRAPVNPRCTGSWLHPQWIAELDEMRVGAACQQPRALETLPDDNDEPDEERPDLEDTDAHL